jgi:putative glutamine amidotransferase
MKTIILSPKIVIDKYDKINFLIDEDMSNFLNEIKIKILPINLKKNKINLKNIDSVDGLILAGGGDIFEYDKTSTNKIRDNYEKKLFNIFFQKNKPILLICRGFQLLSSIYKKKLFKFKNHVRKNHNLDLKKSRFINYQKLAVNSYHNYGIKELPKNYINIANTKDGSIEIAEHKYKKILCLMFHPERKMKSEKKLVKVIRNFF